MDCQCHGEPAYWQKDKRRPLGGSWRCAVKKREANRRSHAKHCAKRLAARRARQLERWHAADGGYVKRRLRELVKQRAHILERLDQLDQEATDAQS